MVAALGVIPRLLVVAVDVDGLSLEPCVSHGRLTERVVFATPPIAWFVLGRLNRYGRLRTLAPTAGASAATAVWWAIPLVPAVALCSAASGNACL